MIWLVQHFEARDSYLSLVPEQPQGCASTTSYLPDGVGGTHHHTKLSIHDKIRKNGDTQTRLRHSTDTKYILWYRIEANVFLLLIVGNLLVSVTANE